MKKIIVLMTFTICISSVSVLPVLINAQESEEAKSQLNRAMSLIEKGRFDEAIDQFLKIVEKNPNYGLAYSNLGAVYYKRGKLDKAIEASRKAIEINPNDKAAHGNLGNIYTDLKRYDEAISEHKKVIELTPNDADAYTNLGTAFSKKGNTEEGVDQFKKAVSLNPHHPLARKNLGYSYYNMRKWPEAIDELLSVREIDPWYPGVEESLTITLKKAYPDLEKWANEKPMDPPSHYYFAYALEYKGKWKKAIEEMEKAIKLDRSKGEFYKGMALFYSSANKPKEAITILRECTTVDPSNWACYNALGAEYARLDKRKEALDLMMKASDINPNIVSIQANLGIAYLINSEYQKSIESFKNALSLSGRGDPRIDLNLASAYFEVQIYDMAWRHARRAERMGNPKASELIKDLRRVSKEPE